MSRTPKYRWQRVAELVSITVVDLAELLHEISVAFTASTNLRTLLPRLATGMSRYVSVIEVEIVVLHRNGSEVDLVAYSPDSLRQWTGQRSARFLQRQLIRGAQWCRDLEPPRVASASVALQLKLGVGRGGVLILSFGTDISVELGKRSTEILVSSLTGHCQRLGQLDETARCSHHAHRYFAKPEDDPQTDISVIPMSPTPNSDTDISVETIDVALVDCISAALSVTRGRIYGEAGAAKLLGLKPSTLQSKMRKLGIERMRFVA
jgi:transcriptional regulator with GAF, ATPase, and Fis domain